MSKAKLRCHSGARGEGLGDNSPIGRLNWEEFGGKTPDPQPRSFEEIFEPRIWARLEELGELAIHEGAGRMPAKRFESYLPEMALLIGQSDMPKARLDRAPKLRAIINVETNFLQNVDYETCFERGIHVLAPGLSAGRSPRWRSEWRSTSAGA